MATLNSLDDHEIVNGILSNNRPLIEYFFQRKCSKLFSYILLNVFDGHVDQRELVNELYLFMASNDWAVFRKFQYRSSLMTYVSVVAVRFFQKKRMALIDSTPAEELNEKMRHGYNYGSTLEQRMDIYSALQKMPNARYRQVIETLDLQGVPPKELAREMNVIIDNLPVGGIKSVRT